MSDIIKTEKAAKPLGAYPHARKVGPFIFVSGISSRNFDNTIDGYTTDSTGNPVLDIR